MNKTNQFFKTVYSRPSLIWKGCAGILFLALALAILFLPSLTGNLDDNTRYAFSGLLVLYALFRIGTFYSEYRTYRDE